MGLGGIFGFFFSSKTMSGEDIINIIEVLKNFGKDGYGIAYIKDGELRIERHIRYKRFVELISNIQIEGISIGACRQAIYGRPALVNTPPHTDCNGKIVVVARGVLRNQGKIREQLMERGHILEGKDISEIIAHEIEDYSSRRRNIDEVVKEIYGVLDGMYSALILDMVGNKLYLLCRETSEYIGKFDKGFMACSEYDAIIGGTSDLMRIDKGVVCIDGAQLRCIGKTDIVNIGEVRKSKVPGGFDYYMEREMAEIPWILKFQNIAQKNEYIGLATRLIESARRIYMIGSGSSYNAALYGAYVINELSDVEPIAQNATEFIYFMLKRVKAGDVIIANSQSGETSDVLRAVSKSRLRGALIIGVLNMLGSPLMFASNVYIPIAAGIENAIPATKTFVAQVYTFSKIALGLMGKKSEYSRELNEAIGKIPELTRFVLEESKKVVKSFAELIKDINSVFVLGRGVSFPIALEGALKLKEVAQIHAEGIDAGEFRHGSKTLLGWGYPVVVMVPQDLEAREDTYALIDEIKNITKILILTNKADPFADKFSKFVVKIPVVPEIFAPILYVIVLQELALCLGKLRGTPIDMPPMLEKFVILSK